MLGQDWKKLQQYLNKSESEFETFIKDTTTLYKLAGRTENREENVNVFKKQFDFFLYNKDSAGARDLYSGITRKAHRMKIYFPYRIAAISENFQMDITYV